MPFLSWFKWCSAFLFHLKKQIGAELAKRVSGSEVFGWSRISNNTGSRSRFFLSDTNSGCPIGSFLHHTSKLGIPVEMVQFFLKL